VRTAPREFEPNYFMIRQHHATVPISNDRSIRLNGFVMQFLVHLCNYFLNNLRSILLIDLERGPKSFT
jgi:hypothetical protein